MPFTVAQLAAGANTQLESYRRNSPIDQVGTARPFLDFLLSNKKEVVFGNGYWNETLRLGTNSNYQNYFGADQVTYNTRQPIRMAKWAYANFHDGFMFDEDTLKANGIVMTDDKTAVPTEAEKIQIVNLLETAYYDLKEGVHEQFNIEMLRDGTQSTKAAIGLDGLIDTTPATGTIAGIDASTATYWQNNANMAISTNLLAEMEETWRACMLYGGQPPTHIFAGSAFIDAYRAAMLAANYTQVNYTGGKGGISAMDGAVSDLYFHGVKIVWDPSFEQMDALLGTITYPWTKRAYFINSKTLTLRPYKGAWMVKRKPERLPDRYVHYWGLTSSYALTINKRNANAVLSVA